MLDSTPIVLRLIEAFDRIGVPYMLVGAYSSNYYGRPRATHDADFVVEIEGEQLVMLARDLGNGFKIDKQMSFETVTMTTRHIIVHPETAFKIELFLLSDDPHDRSRFARRRQVNFEGRNAWLPSPEDVVITKLRWSKGGRRAKDVEDVAKILSVRMARLDQEYLRSWLTNHGTLALFEELSNRVDEQSQGRRNSP